VGEAGTPVPVASLPGRRAGLEFVEKLLTDSMVALLDGAERERAYPASRSSHRGRAGYWFVLRVALVVVAVAYRRLGPSSSAVTSTVDRALPSSAVQLAAEVGP
jgi:hypothetical protein